MTDIDWSKVPEGAQYYSASDDGFYTFYRHIEDSTYEIFYCGGTRWVLHVGSPEEHYTIIPRHAPAWNGEGLPLVGVACEAFYMGQPQGVVSVRYSGQCMILWSEDRKSEQCGQADHYLFKPIRTPEQIAADEREAAIDEIRRELIPVDEYVAELILDAITRLGYRKP